MTPSTPPTSSPAPSAPPVVSSQSVCDRMGDGKYAAPCSKASARYYDAVDGAIEKLIKKQPYLFDLNDVAAPGSYRVLEPDEDWLHWSIPDPVPIGTKAAFDRTVAELSDRIGALAGRAA